MPTDVYTIDLTVSEDRLQRSVKRARERNIIVPTFAQMKDPARIPDRFKEELSSIGLWDVHPRNLFRISWHNEAQETGDDFGEVNYLELPSSLTGVPARIVGLVGKWFPTGAHKVGAAFGCLVPRLVTGQFDPTSQKTVWPSTGNFCRGGAYDSALLACPSIAILPEGMSRERFDWLAGIAGEVIKTTGSESNVKEIFDKCRELRESGEDLWIFNQFEEFGNYLWHFEITGHAMEAVCRRLMGPHDTYRGLVVATGSAGTLGSGDYMKQLFADSKIVASEALQCPTLLENGFGAHRIEGIGDKHVPWLHNCKNTDMVLAIDDNAVISTSRLFNEPIGRHYLARQGVPEAIVGQLDLMGLSGISNLLSAIKFAKYYDLGEHDLVMTVFTDSMDLYQSRLQEMRAQCGDYSETDAATGFSRWLQGQSIDNVLELRHTDRRRIHNLKYFTWIEQQGRSVDELLAQWDDQHYWTGMQRQISEIDAQIDEFNQRVGLI